MDNPETLLPKFFAFEDALMLEHVEGAIEITEQQYNEALAAKIAGRKAFVRDGELVIFSGIMRPIWNCEDGSTKEIDEQELIPEGWTDKE
ncbi:phage tail protein, partial [Bacillus cereus]